MDRFQTRFSLLMVSLSYCLVSSGEIEGLRMMLEVFITENVSPVTRSGLHKKGVMFKLTAELKYF